MVILSTFNKAANIWLFYSNSLSTQDSSESFETVLIIFQKKN